MLNILKSYFRKYRRNFTAEHLLRKEYAYFNTCSKILDVGCGEGDFVILDKKRIQGIDLNKKSIRTCKGRNLNAICADALKMPFKSSSFDGVYCSHLIEHFLPDKAYMLLNEVSRVLKPGGILVLATPIMWDGFYNDFTHVKPYNPESIERYLCENGRQKTFNDFPYSFRKTKIEWRYGMFPIPGKIGRIISDFLYPYGFHTFQKNAYTLVLIKIK